MSHKIYFTTLKIILRDDITAISKSGTPQKPKYRAIAPIIWGRNPGILAACGKIQKKKVKKVRNDYLQIEPSEV